MMPQNKLIQFIIVLALLLAACTAPTAEEEEAAAETAVPSPPPTAAEQVAATAASTEVPMLELPDLGPAPEFKNETWLNADEPVTLASLRGKVVLLEFWTFG